MPISARATSEASRFTPYQTLLAGLLIFLQFAVVADYLIIAPLGAMIMPALAISPAEFGMIVSAHAFSAGLAGLLTAGFVDRLDHRKVLLFFCAGFVAGTIWCGPAETFSTLLMARAVTGLSGGALGSVIFATAADLFQPSLRSRVIGVIQTTFTAAQVLSLPLGLYLSNRWTWHVPFLVLAGAGFAAGFLILLWMQPAAANRLVAAEQNSLPHILRTVSEPRFAQGFLAMALLTMGGFLVFPFSSAFAVGNLGVPFDSLPAIYLIAGIGTIASGIFVGKAADSAGTWPTFLAGNALAVAVVLIYTQLIDASLAMIAVLNFLMFAGIFARMVPFRAFLTSIPELSRRNSFNAAGIAVQYFASGLAACVAGWIVSFGPDGELKQFEVLGYVLAALTAVATVLVWKIHTDGLARAKRG